MNYVGHQPATTFDSGIQDRFTGLTTNTVTLTYDISAEEDILVVWNNIVQDKNTYSVGGTGNKTVTLGGTLVSADVVTVYYLNRVMQSVNPTAGSVTSTTITDDIISGQTALGAEPADTDEFLVSDAGTLKRVDYSHIKGEGNLVKVHTITASDDSTVTFNSTYLTSTYKRYTLEAFDIQSANDNVYLELSFSVDNGSNYLTGAITRINISNSSDATNDEIHSRNTLGQNTLQLGGGTNFGTGTGEVGAFTFELVNFSDTAHYKLLYYNGALFNSGGTGGINLGAGTVATTSAINNIKFNMDTGNIAAGTFILYGIA